MINSAVVKRLKNLSNHLPMPFTFLVIFLSTVYLEIKLVSRSLVLEE